MLMRYILAIVLAMAGLAAPVSTLAAPSDWRRTGICDVPSADFPTIQSAIDQTATDTAKGCEIVRLASTTTFQEQIVIWRSLTLTGTKGLFGPEKTKEASRLHPPDVMDPNNPRLIWITGNRTRAKIKKLVIEGPISSDRAIAVGADRNAKLVLQDSIVRDIRPPIFDSTWGFEAIHLGGPYTGPVKRAKLGISAHEINNSLIDGYQNAAIVVEGEGITATVYDSVIDAAPDSTLDKVRAATAAAPVGVLVLPPARTEFVGPRVTITRSDVLNNKRDGGGGVGVFLQSGGAPAQVVSFNNIFDSNVGVMVQGTHGVKIFRNHLVDSDLGIIGADSNTNLIQLNLIEDGVTGLLLMGQSTSNIVSGNNFQHNSGAGAVLSDETAKNKVLKNRAQNNGSYGFADGSHGNGTKGTNNTYSGNFCAGNNGL